MVDYTLRAFCVENRAYFAIFAITCRPQYRTSRRIYLNLPM